MKISIPLLIVGTVLLAASSASAHLHGVYAPVVPAPVVPAPVAAYYATGPVVPYAPVVTTAYYAPPAAFYPAPAPYYVAAPIVAPVVAPVAVAPVYYGPAVVVRPKVYVRGEPVRNVLRAVTP
jgi:hypothetical protein